MLLRVSANQFVSASGEAAQESVKLATGNLERAVRFNTNLKRDVIRVRYVAAGYLV